MELKPKVLVVDDEESLRSSIGKILEMHGFEVRLASNVPEGLAFIRAESFNVLISDLKMPGPGDGLTVIEAMRASNPKAITLLMSAFTDPGQATVRLRADEILRKPVAMREVVGLIRQKLASAGEPQPGSAAE
ncbi:response regulator [Granulicella sibirica]|uniref:Two component, sigma54 specific, transcriptional regulator, Fis family n=1 Tax=Granulicella sibirica TaxID=2479048 RepID=A0A4Q0T1R7_9BACT|nr:response regulator [Granulicella sibirica]RXH55849.1 two component, sigma54 specific, transcriptional regulator, Fis family [Granulicella sibirica]